MNLDSIKPFPDKRVRQAINHAIDTDLIITRLVKDKAYRATSWLPPLVAAFDKTMKPYAFDPEKAKKLLAEAGYPNGFEFEWTTSQNESWGLPIVEAVIPMLARVGIKVKPKLVEVTVLTEIADEGRLPGLYLLQPDRPGSRWPPCAASTPRRRASACNYTGFKNAGLRQAARRGRPGPATWPSASSCCKKANALLYDEAPVWFFNYNKAVMAFSRGSTACSPTRPRLTHQYVEDLWVDADLARQVTRRASLASLPAHRRRHDWSCGAPRGTRFAMLACPRSAASPTSFRRCSPSWRSSSCCSASCRAASSRA